MSIDNLDELNEMHKDALRETGNIGAGNAATALSELLNEQINVEVPRVKILSLQEVLDETGGPNRIVAAVIATLSGDLDGMVALIMDKKFAESSIKIMLNKGEAAFEDMSSMELSAISELGNILLATYITSVSHLADLNINISVPYATVDMIGAVMNMPAMIMGISSDHIIYIEDDILIRNEKVSANLLLIPSLDSLNILFEKLGLSL